MTDIVERLRRPDDGDPFNAGWNACLAEAADEIERLTEQVKLDTTEFERLNTDIVKRARKAIEAADEIERLRGLCDDITHDNDLLIRKIMEFEPQWKLER